MYREIPDQGDSIGRELLSKRIYPNIHKKQRLLNLVRDADECGFCLQKTKIKSFPSIIQQSLSLKYRLSLDYFYKKDINKILKGLDSTALTNFLEVCFDNPEEPNLSEFYGIKHLKAKFANLWKFHQFNIDQPKTLFSKYSQNIVEDYYFTKRKKQEKAIKRMLDTLTDSQLERCDQYIDEYMKEQIIFEENRNVSNPLLRSIGSITLSIRKPAPVPDYTRKLLIRDISEIGKEFERQSLAPKRRYSIIAYGDFGKDSVTEVLPKKESDKVKASYELPDFVSESFTSYLKAAHKSRVASSQATSAKFKKKSKINIVINFPKKPLDKKLLRTIKAKLSAIKKGGIREFNERAIGNSPIPCRGNIKRGKASSPHSVERDKKIFTRRFVSPHSLKGYSLSSRFTKIRKAQTTRSTSKKEMGIRSRIKQSQCDLFKGDLSIDKTTARAKSAKRPHRRDKSTRKLSRAKNCTVISNYSKNTKNRESKKSNKTSKSRSFLKRARQSEFTQSHASRSMKYMSQNQISQRTNENIFEKLKAAHLASLATYRTTRTLNTSGPATPERSLAAKKLKISKNVFSNKILHSKIKKLATRQKPKKGDLGKGHGATIASISGELLQPKRRVLRQGKTIH